MNKANARYQPFLVPFSPTTQTFVGSWQSTNGGSTSLFLPLSPASGYVVGTIVWHVNGQVNTDGQDIIAGLFNIGVDGFGDNNFNSLDGQVLFHGAAVKSTDEVPEPATALLLGIGLAGLVMRQSSRAGRRVKSAVIVGRH